MSSSENSAHKAVWQYMTYDPIYRISAPPDIESRNPDGAGRFYSCVSKGISKANTRPDSLVPTMHLPMMANHQRNRRMQISRDLLHLPLLAFPVTSPMTNKQESYKSNDGDIKDANVTADIL